jgi:hypothetical protein
MVGSFCSRIGRDRVGCVKPRANDSALVDMIRLLPVGIGVAPVYLNFAQGTREEQDRANSRPWPVR